MTCCFRRAFILLDCALVCIHASLGFLGCFLIKSSATRAGGPGFQSQLSYTNGFKTDILVVARLDVWVNGVSDRPGWVGVRFA